MLCISNLGKGDPKGRNDFMMQQVCFDDVGDKINAFTSLFTRESLH